MYAFRVYAAVYGHSCVEDAARATIRCFYGRFPESRIEASTFRIPALYQTVCDAEERPKFTKHRYAAVDFYLRHGLEGESGKPDWLAEIFHWLSSGYEAHIVARDSVERIPYAETVFHQERLSPRTPHASLLMAWMESALRGASGEQLWRAPSPVPHQGHLILCTHDVDFYYVNRTSALVRLVKNLALAATLYRSRSYFLENLQMIFQTLTGERVGDYLPKLLAAESDCDVQSTFFVVSRRGHRRDPNYRLEEIASRLMEAAQPGFSIGLHGSYQSVLEDGSLRTEAVRIAESIRRYPIAGRQHWLRFRNHRDLFAQVAEAGLSLDSTLGFPEMVGYRNGASFPFPPYDFEHETAHEFLEVPLVLMDGSLKSASDKLQMEPLELAEEVLGQSRKVGWGGIAILWHNPVEPLSVPSEINQVFWKLANRQKTNFEKWIGVEQLLSACLARYHQAGLLRRVELGGWEQSTAATAKQTSF